MIDSETFDQVQSVDQTHRAKIAAGVVSAVLKNYNEIELEFGRDATDAGSIDGARRAEYGISCVGIYSADCL